MNNKYCINCNSILVDRTLDFCSPECEHEFRLGCDQELLTNLSTVESVPDKKEEVKDFSNLLGNVGPDGKVTKD